MQNRVLAGVLAIVAASGTTAHGQARAVAVEGDISPNGDVFGDLAVGTGDEPVIGNTGDIAFLGEAGTGSGTDGIWVEIDGVLHEVVREGDFVPGLGTREFNSFGSLRVGRDGRVGFRSSIDAASGIGSVESYWLWTPASGLSAYAIEGEPAGFSSPANAIVEDLSQGEFAMNDRGEAAFRMEWSCPSCPVAPDEPIGLVAGFPGNLRIEVERGDLVTGQQIDAIGTVHTIIGSAGDVGGVVFFTNSAGTLTPCIYLGDSLVVCDNDPAITGDPGDFYSPIDAENFVIGGSLLSFQAGITDDELEPVAFEGAIFRDALPVFADGVPVDGRIVDLPNPPTGPALRMNEADELAVITDTSDGDVAWRVFAIGPQALAVEGDPAPGFAGEVFSSMRLPIIGGTGLDDTRVAFIAELSAARLGLFATDAISQLDVLLRDQDTIDLDPDPTSTRNATVDLIRLNNEQGQSSGLSNGINDDGSITAVLQVFELGSGVLSAVVVFERCLKEERDCPADIDGDGSLTTFDFLAFQNAFDAGELAADFDCNGVINFFDFTAFQTAFDAGCP
ncbi:MAG: GC-type dockerin domain-anchored protein [Planctomycetota bacterium]